ncbi:MAG: DUF882 domain-containing protein [Rhizobiaceae bacterium]
MKSASFQDKDGQAALVSFALHRHAVMICLALFVAALFSASLAQAETRTLRMHFTHTKESVTITFKKNGKYIPSGLKKANRFLRDWRRKEPTKMDPALLDLVWEVYQKSGSRKPIKVISGYRSPRTNNMLRRRGRKVARKSQHTRGKALDFFLQDVSVAKLRALGLKAHRGGVGYYAGSFVHLDTGSVRHWPRMSRRQLSRVFPKGRTIHVPSNGKPLKGYKVAKANLKKGLNADGSRRTTKVRRTLLASLVSNRSGNSDEDEGSVVNRRQEAKRPKLAKPVRAASLQRQPKNPNGADPFSLENSAAGQPKKPAEVKPTEPVASKPDASVEIALNRIAVPRQRPRRNTPAEAPVILAAVPASVDGSLLRPAAQTELALAAPAAWPKTLRPPADIPGQNAEIAASLVEQQRLASLNSRIETALARGRVQSPAELAAEKQGNSKLVEALREIPVPSRPQRRPVPTQLALASIPETTPRSAAKLTPAKQSGTEQNVVVDSSRFASAEVTDPTTPSWRTSLRQELIAASANRLRVPLPSSKPIRQNQQAVVASGGETVSTENTYALSLGDLDGNSVKEWAVSLSTRVGPVAALKAPNYSQITQHGAPDRVYSAGFAQGARFVLRADRFSGRALTRVAFATFN